MERKDNSSDVISDVANEGEVPDVALAIMLIHAHGGRDVAGWLAAGGLFACYELVGYVRRVMRRAMTTSMTQTRKEAPAAGSRQQRSSGGHVAVRSAVPPFFRFHLLVIMMSNSRTHSFVALAIVAAALSSLSPALSFAPPHRLEGVATRHPTTTSSAGLVIGSTAPSRYNIMKLLAESEDGESSSTATADDPKKLSLEEKMKSWEASEEEIKAASLGGITAGSKGGADGFDVGLWVMASLKICLACFLYFLPWL